MSHRAAIDLGKDGIPLIIDLMSFSPQLEMQAAAGTLQPCHI